MRLAVLLLVACACWTAVHCISWLSLHQLRQAGEWQLNASAGCRDGVLRRVLTGVQTQLCSSQPGLMSAVVTAASTAVSYCQRAFRHRRWNCSSVTLAPDFSADLTTGTREHAVVHALSTASLVWAVARACRKGTVLECGCGAYPLDPPNGRFQWGGCSDNLYFARDFSRKFLANDKKNKAHKEQGASLQSSSRRRNERQRYDSEPMHKKEHRKIRRRKERRKKGRAMLKREAKIKKIKRRAILRMNRHNRRVGRKVTGTALSTSCKCHGVSGSCTLKTCWKVLSAFNKVSGRLLHRYSTAVQVRPVKIARKLRLLPVAASAVARYSRDDLLYLSPSPDYCTSQPLLGSYGTVGRKCNASSVNSDSCDLLCCGRGHTSSLQLVKQKCSCRYHWCCYVTCDTCYSWKTQHYCL